MEAVFHRLWNVELYGFLLLTTFDILNTQDGKSSPSFRANNTLKLDDGRRVVFSDEVAFRSKAYITPRFSCNFIGNCISVWVVEPKCWNGFLETSRNGYIKISLNTSHCQTHDLKMSALALYWLWGSELDHIQEISRCRHLTVCRIPALAVRYFSSSKHWLDILLDLNDGTAAETISVTADNRLLKDFSLKTTTNKHLIKQTDRLVMKKRRDANLQIGNIGMKRGQKVQARISRKKRVINEAEDIAALMQGESSAAKQKISEMIASDFASGTFDEPVVAHKKAGFARGVNLDNMIRNLQLEADENAGRKMFPTLEQLRQQVKHTEQELAEAEQEFKEAAAAYTLSLIHGLNVDKHLLHKNKVAEKVEDLKSRLKTQKTKYETAYKGPLTGTERKIHGLIAMSPMWSEWTGWSKCSVDCGEGGFSVRRRECETLPDVTCSGISFDMRSCVTGIRCEARFHDWGNWGPCSVTCGKGVRARTRVCVSADEEMKCRGPSTMLEKCSNPRCKPNGAGLPPYVPPDTGPAVGAPQVAYILSPGAGAAAVGGGVYAVAPPPGHGAASPPVQYIVPVAGVAAAGAASSGLAHPAAPIHELHPPAVEEEPDQKVPSATIVFVVLFLLCVLLLIIALCIYFYQRFKEYRSNKKLKEARPFYKPDDGNDYDEDDDDNLYKEPLKGKIKPVWRGNSEYGSSKGMFIPDQYQPTNPENKKKKKDKIEEAVSPGKAKGTSSPKDKKTDKEKQKEEKKEKEKLEKEKDKQKEKMEKGKKEKKTPEEKNEKIDQETSVEGLEKAKKEKIKEKAGKDKKEKKNPGENNEKIDQETSVEGLEKAKKEKTKEKAGKDKKEKKNPGEKNEKIDQETSVEGLEKAKKEKTKEKAGKDKKEKKTPGEKKEKIDEETSVEGLKKTKKEKTKEEKTKEKAEQNRKSPSPALEKAEKSRKSPSPALEKAEKSRKSPSPALEKAEQSRKSPSPVLEKKQKSPKKGEKNNEGEEVDKEKVEKKGKKQKRETPSEAKDKKEKKVMLDETKDKKDNLEEKGKKGKKEGKKGEKEDKGIKEDKEIKEGKKGKNEDKEIKESKKGKKESSDERKTTPGDKKKKGGKEKPGSTSGGKKEKVTNASKNRMASYASGSSSETTVIRSMSQRHLSEANAQRHDDNFLDSSESKENVIIEGQFPTSEVELVQSSFAHQNFGNVNFEHKTLSFHPTILHQDHFVSEKYNPEIDFLSDWKFNKHAEINSESIRRNLNQVHSADEINSDYPHGVVKNSEQKLKRSLKRQRIYRKPKRKLNKYLQFFSSPERKSMSGRNGKIIHYYRKPKYGKFRFAIDKQRTQDSAHSRTTKLSKNKFIVHTSSDSDICTRENSFITTSISFCASTGLTYNSNTDVLQNRSLEAIPTEIPDSNVRQNGMLEARVKCKIEESQGDKRQITRVSSYCEFSKPSMNFEYKVSNFPLQLPSLSQSYNGIHKINYYGSSSSSWLSMLLSESDKKLNEIDKDIDAVLEKQCNFHYGDDSSSSSEVEISDCLPSQSVLETRKAVMKGHIFTGVIENSNESEETMKKAMKGHIFTGVIEDSNESEETMKKAMKGHIFTGVIENSNESEETMKKAMKDEVNEESEVLNKSQDVKLTGQKVSLRDEKQRRHDGTQQEESYEKKKADILKLLHSTSLYQSRGQSMYYSDPRKPFFPQKIVCCDHSQREKSSNFVSMGKLSKENKESTFVITEHASSINAASKGKQPTHSTRAHHINKDDFDMSSKCSQKSPTSTCQKNMMDVSEIKLQKPSAPFNLATCKAFDEIWQTEKNKILKPSTSVSCSVASEFYTPRNDSLSKLQSSEFVKSTNAPNKDHTKVDPHRNRHDYDYKKSQEHKETKSVFLTPCGSSSDICSYQSLEIQKLLRITDPHMLHDDPDLQHKEILNQYVSMTPCKNVIDKNDSGDSKSQDIDMGRNDEDQGIDRNDEGRGMNRNGGTERNDGGCGDKNERYSKQSWCNNEREVSSVQMDNTHIICSGFTVEMIDGQRPGMVTDVQSSLASTKQTIFVSAPTSPENFYQERATFVHNNDKHIQRKYGQLLLDDRERYEQILDEQLENFVDSTSWITNKDYSKIRIEWDSNKDSKRHQFEISQPHVPSHDFDFFQSPTVLSETTFIKSFEKQQTKLSESMFNKCVFGQGACKDQEKQQSYKPSSSNLVQKQTSEMYEGISGQASAQNSYQSFPEYYATPRAMSALAEEQTATEECQWYSPCSKITSSDIYNKYLSPDVLHHGMHTKESYHSATCDSFTSLCNKISTPASQVSWRTAKTGESIYKSPYKSDTSFCDTNIHDSCRAPCSLNSTFSLASAESINNSSISDIESIIPIQFGHRNTDSLISVSKDTINVPTFKGTVSEYANMLFVSATTNEGSHNHPDSNASNTDSYNSYNSNLCFSNEPQNINDSDIDRLKYPDYVHNEAFCCTSEKENNGTEHLQMHDSFRKFLSPDTFTHDKCFVSDVPNGEQLSTVKNITEKISHSKEQEINHFYQSYQNKQRTQPVSFWRNAKDGYDMQLLSPCLSVQDVSDDDIDDVAPSSDEQTNHLSISRYNSDCFGEYEYDFNQVSFTQEVDVIQASSAQEIDVNQGSSAQEADVKNIYLSSISTLDTAFIKSPEWNPSWTCRTDLTYSLPCSFAMRKTIDSSPVYLTESVTGTELRHSSQAIKKHSWDKKVYSDSLSDFESRTDTKVSKLFYANSSAEQADLLQNSSCEGYISSENDSRNRNGSKPDHILSEIDCVMPNIRETNTYQNIEVQSLDDLTVKTENVVCKGCNTHHVTGCERLINEMTDIGKNNVSQNVQSFTARFDLTTSFYKRAIEWSPLFERSVDVQANVTTTGLLTHTHQTFNSPADGISLEHTKKDCKVSVQHSDLQNVHSWSSSNDNIESSSLCFKENYQSTEIFHTKCNSFAECQTLDKPKYQYTDITEQSVEPISNLKNKGNIDYEQSFTEDGCRDISENNAYLSDHIYTESNLMTGSQVSNTSDDISVLPEDSNFIHNAREKLPAEIESYQSSIQVISEDKKYGHSKSKIKKHRTEFTENTSYSMINCKAEVNPIKDRCIHDEHSEVKSASVVNYVDECHGMTRKWGKINSLNLSLDSNLTVSGHEISDENYQQKTIYNDTLLGKTMPEKAHSLNLSLSSDLTVCVLEIPDMNIETPEVIHNDNVLNISPFQTSLSLRVNDTCRQETQSSSSGKEQNTEHLSLFRSLQKSTNLIASSSSAGSSVAHLQRNNSFIPDFFEDSNVTQVRWMPAAKQVDTTEIDYSHVECMKTILSDSHNISICSDMTDTSSESHCFSQNKSYFSESHSSSEEKSHFYGDYDHNLHSSSDEKSSCSAASLNCESHTSLVEKNSFSAENYCKLNGSSDEKDCFPAFTSNSKSQSSLEDKSCLCVIKHSTSHNSLLEHNCNSSVNYSCNSYNYSDETNSSLMSNQESVCNKQLHQQPLLSAALSSYDDSHDLLWTRSSSGSSHQDSLSGLSTRNDDPRPDIYSPQRSFKFLDRFTTLEEARIQISPQNPQQSNAFCTPTLSQTHTCHRYKWGNPCSDSYIEINDEIDQSFNRDEPELILYNFRSDKKTNNNISEIKYKSLIQVSEIVSERTLSDKVQSGRDSGDSSKTSFYRACSLSQTSSGNADTSIVGTSVVVSSSEETLGKCAAGVNELHPLQKSKECITQEVVANLASDNTSSNISHGDIKTLQVINMDHTKMRQLPLKENHQILEVKSKIQHNNDEMISISQQHKGYLYQNNVSLDENDKLETSYMQQADQKCLVQLPWQCERTSNVYHTLFNEHCTKDKDDTHNHHSSRDQTRICSHEENTWGQDSEANLSLQQGVGDVPITDGNHESYKVISECIKEDDSYNSPESLMLKWSAHDVDKSVTKYSCFDSQHVSVFSKLSRQLSSYNEPSCSGSYQSGLSSSYNCNQEGVSTDYGTSGSVTSVYPDSLTSSQGQCIVYTAEDVTLTDVCFQEQGQVYSLCGSTNRACIQEHCVDDSTLTCSTILQDDSRQDSSTASFKSVLERSLRDNICHVHSVLSMTNLPEKEHASLSLDPDGFVDKEDTVSNLNKSSATSLSNRSHICSHDINHAVSSHTMATSNSMGSAVFDKDTVSSLKESDATSFSNRSHVYSHDRSLHAVSNYTAAIYNSTHTGTFDTCDELLNTNSSEDSTDSSYTDFDMSENFPLSSSNQIMGATHNQHLKHFSSSVIRSHSDPTSMSYNRDNLDDQFSCVSHFTDTSSQLTDD